MRPRGRWPAQDLSGSPVYSRSTERSGHWLALLLAAAMMIGASRLAPIKATGLRVSGSDRATVVLPAGARVADYDNHGYRLRRDRQYAWIEVSGTPLESAFPFSSPALAARTADPIRLLAHRLSVGSETRFEAVSRVLAWVSAQIEYRLDRSQSQKPAAVLARRSAYCTGVARLTVALLEALEIEAREVPGFVATESTVDAAAEEVAGYHRWIEVYYPDVGWVFSDPTRFHHYVPAHYVRLSGELLEVDRLGQGGQIIRRDNRIGVIDAEAKVPSGVQVVPNDSSRRAAALRVETGRTTVEGEVFLERAGVIHRQPLDDDGGCDFVGLTPATYTVRVRWKDGESSASEMVIDGLERFILEMTEAERVPRAAGSRRP